jgi:hypothetical protein
MSGSSWVIVVAVRAHMMGVVPMRPVVPVEMRGRWWRIMMVVLAVRILVVRSSA